MQNLIQLFIISVYGERMFVTLFEEVYAAQEDKIELLKRSFVIRNFYSYAVNTGHDEAQVF